MFCDLIHKEVSRLFISSLRGWHFNDISNLFPSLNRTKQRRRSMVYSPLWKDMCDMTLSIPIEINSKHICLRSSSSHSHPKTDRHARVRHAMRIYTYISEWMEIVFVEMNACHTVSAIDNKVEVVETMWLIVQSCVFVMRL